MVGWEHGCVGDGVGERLLLGVRHIHVENIVWTYKENKRIVRERGAWQCIHSWRGVAHVVLAGDPSFFSTELETWCFGKVR